MFTKLIPLCHIVVGRCQRIIAPEDGNRAGLLVQIPVLILVLFCVAVMAIATAEGSIVRSIRNARMRILSERIAKLSCVPPSELTSKQHRKIAQTQRARTRLLRAMVGGDV